MKLTNVEMQQFATLLEPLLERDDILGYIAARNIRTFREALKEYTEFREKAILEFGKHDVDEDGNELPTVSIYPGDENFDEFAAKMSDVMNVEQEVNIVTTSYENAIGKLTGQQILDLDWMFTD